MKRIGLMGCGVVASYGHLPAIVGTKGLELAAVFDPDLRRAEDAKAKFGAGGAYCDEAAFFESGLDAVVVTSPAPCHPGNVREAARHGLHVLCEKPLAMSEGEIEGMIRVMGDAGLKLYTGFTYRFGPSALAIKRMVKEGAIGKVLDLRLVYIWTCHGKSEADASGKRVENPRRRGRMLEGGPMVDCGVHQIDLARWWLGSEVVGTRGIGAWVDEYDAPDHVYLHMDHAGGQHTLVEISYSYGHTAAERCFNFGYELMGTEGLIRYYTHSQEFELRTARGTTKLEWRPEKNFEGMYEEFERALRTGEDGEMPTGLDGLVATRLAREGTEEAVRGRR